MMQDNKKKQKKNHVVIFTSDADNASVKQIRIKPWILETIIVILCIVVGALGGYLLYEERIWATAIKSKNENIAALKELEAQNKELQQKMTDKEALLNEEIRTLNDKIVILSNTLEQKVQSEGELLDKLNKQCLPTEFPLNGPANLEETEERKDKICIFSASDGISVIATASGTVTAITEDFEFGYSVTIDHGNGYVSVYKNQGKPIVKLGDEVIQGAMIYQITKKNKKFGYQIMLDDEYVDPMDMLSING